MRDELSNFEAWQQSVHLSLRDDPLWKFQVYPKALFLYDLTWEDCEYLLKDERNYRNVKTKH